MSIYPPPNWTEALTTFNSSNYGQTVATNATSIAFLDANYVKYPVAQGEVTFTNTNNTGNMTVQGNLLTNTITGTTTTSAISLYNSITSSNIELGASLVSGATLKIGNANNSNHLGLVDFTGNTINNVVPTTGALYICNNQTSGGLYIGGGTSRSGSINIGNGAGSTSTISIGTSTSTINLFGSTVTANSINLIPQNLSSALNQSISDNVSQNFFVNSTNSTNSRTLTLPVNPYNGQKITFVNRSTTNNNTVIVGNTGTQTINGYGLTSVTSFTVYTGQAVIVQWVDTARNYWVIQYKSNETYQPVVPTYTSLTAYTNLTQLGYTYSQSVAQAITTTTGTTTYSMLLDPSPFPVGLYSITIRNILTSGTGVNTVKDIVSTLSTTTLATGGITGIVDRRLPVNTALPASNILYSSAVASYTRSSVVGVYITLAFNTTTYASTGITPTLAYSITRIA